MDDLSLAHSRYNCTYHIVFIPKYRGKAMFGTLRKEVGEILGKVCKMEEVTIIKASTMPDHVHMYVSIPPKSSVSKVVGRIKGKIAPPGRGNPFKYTTAQRISGNRPDGNGCTFPD